MLVSVSNSVGVLVVRVCVLHTLVVLTSNEPDICSEMSTIMCPFAENVYHQTHILNIDYTCSSSTNTARFEWQIIYITYFRILKLTEYDLNIL